MNDRVPDWIAMSDMAWLGRYAVGLWRQLEIYRCRAEELEHVDIGGEAGGA